MNDRPHAMVPAAVAATAAWSCGATAAVRLAAYLVAPAWTPRWADTTPSAAAAILLACLAIGCHLRGYRRAGALMGGLVAAFALACLAEVVGGRRWHALGGVDPVLRVRPSAAAALAVAGAALVALGLPFPTVPVRVAAVLAAALLGLVLAAGLGYDPWRWFDAGTASLRMVPLTAVLLGGVGVALLALATALGSPERGGAPAWVPAALAVGFATVALTLWSALLLDEQDHLHDGTYRAAGVLRAALLRERDARVHAVTRLAGRWDPEVEGDVAHWRVDADAQIEHLGHRWLVLATPDGKRRAEAPPGVAPPAESPALSEDLRRAAASTDGAAIFTHVPGGDLVVTAAGHSGGRVRAIVQMGIAPATLLNVAIATPLVPTYGFALDDGDERLLESGWTEGEGEVVDGVVLGDRRLTLRVAPGSQLKVFHRSIVPGAVLGAMVLLVLLASVFARRAGLRAESEARAHDDLRRAQRAARIGSWDLDVARNALRWSDELCRLHGVDPASAPGTLEGFVDRIVPDDRDRMLSAIGEAYAEGAPFAFDYRVLRPDGLLRTIEARGEVELDRHGRVAHLVGTGRDVTETRAMEERLLRQREELEEQNRRVTAADRKKTEFLANMSHELRTPLNSIIGFTELMHDGRAGPMTADQKDLLADVLSSARHLLDLIGDVLDIARVESGRLTLRRETVDLGELVTDTVALVRVEAARRGLRLRAEVAPDAGTVVTDPSRLRQVLVNFLSNALKFTPEGGSITVRARGADPDAYRVEVEDTGIGIRHEDFGRLFEEFEPLDASTSKRYPGTGLGLALSRRIVEAMGGTIGVESEAGRGSVFHALLPRVPPPKTPQASPAPA